MNLTFENFWFIFVILAVVPFPGWIIYTVIILGILKLFELGLGVIGQDILANKIQRFVNSFGCEKK